ncbi:MAG: hypothetical protein KME10_00415 [Plectolyngbya sp. WJT66-NPBG17]|jgi:hypothetical protein|nr:hypothetical protein [Plectolyngbya sp. WJT66-NPBG17]MBW4523642.1 hypothetical protein [Phormidium tanganyikae FI6-MK23]
MNPNGRIVGGVLVGVALLWLLRTLGALPFSDRSTNQLNQNQAAAQTPPDRPLINDFDATRTSIANFNPGTGTGTENFETPGTGTGSGDLAQTPGTPSGTGTTTGTTPGASTRPAAPAIPGAW